VGSQSGCLSGAGEAGRQASAPRSRQQSASAQQPQPPPTAPSAARRPRARKSSFDGEQQGLRRWVAGGSSRACRSRQHQNLPVFA
jgi:hypothetical protein